MAILEPPLKLLSNGGKVRQHDLSDPEIAAALSAHAMAGAEGKDRAAAWAETLYNGANEPLRIEAETLLHTVELSSEIEYEALTRRRGLLAATHLVKTSITDEVAAARSRLERAFMPLGILGICLLAFAEGKLLFQAVMVSGLFGLVPGVIGDTLFAAAFAALPLVVGLVTRSFIGNLDSQTRQAKARVIYRWAKVLFGFWVVLMALVFGPNMTEAVDLTVDPYAETPRWSEATQSFLKEAQKTLQRLSALELIGLIGVSTATASASIASLLINDREANARALVEHVRDDETALHAEERIERIIADRLATDAAARAPLRAILAAIEAGRAEFAERVVARVEELQEVGEVCRREAILNPPAKGELIDAGSRFRR